MSKRLKDDRHLIITAYPGLPGNLKTIFTIVNDSLRKIIENPPFLRDAGWNLPTYERAEIVRGESIRVGNTNYRFLQVYRDGTVIFAVRADEDFLAWETPKNEYRLNPTALVEIVYNCTAFFQQVLSDFEQIPDTIFIRVDLRNLHHNGIKTYLLPYSSVAWRFGGNQDVKFAPTDKMTKTIKFDTGNFVPNIASFKVLKEVYLWFGLEEDQIPYIVVKDGQKAVDPNKIQTLKS